MRRLVYSIPHKKRASTLLALGDSEREAADSLLEAKLYREAVVHMYFACFYVSQALLVQHVTSSVSHKSLEAMLHRKYGRHSSFPRRYVALHTALHGLRTTTDYRTVHAPSPSILAAKQRQLRAYLKFALRVVPRVGLVDILRDMHSANPKQVLDFSFDLYCPRTYAHHTRLTLWMPPFYLDIAPPERALRYLRRALQQLRVNRHADYVLGLNSRMSQYRAVHCVMLDIDSIDASVEASLKQVGGLLLKSGRGFHFIGRRLLASESEWARLTRKLARSRGLRKHVDQKHVSFSLARGYATLRMTESPAKPYAPFFYKEL